MISGEGVGEEVAYRTGVAEADAVGVAEAVAVGEAFGIRVGVAEADAVGDAVGQTQLVLSLQKGLRQKPL